MRNYETLYNYHQTYNDFPPSNCFYSTFRCLKEENNPKRFDFEMPPDKRSTFKRPHLFAAANVYSRENNAISKPVLIPGLHTSNSFGSRGNNSSHNLVFDFMSSTQSTRKMRALTKSKQPSLSSTHYRSVRQMATPGPPIPCDDPSPPKQTVVPCLTNSPPHLNLDGIITSNRASFDYQNKQRTLLISEFNNTSLLNSNTESKSNIHITSVNTLLRKKNSNNYNGECLNGTEACHIYIPINDQMETS